MAIATKEKSSYRAEWERGQERERGELPAWVLRLREEAFEEFERRGFPTTDEEDWKYTSVAPIERTNFALTGEAQIPATDKRDDGALREIVGAAAGASRLVFAEGAFRPDLSSLEGLPAGVIVASLRETFAGEHGSIVREHLGRVGVSDDGFTALNTAFLAEGAFVYLPDGARLTEPLHLLFVAGGAEKPLTLSPRILIASGRGSEATLVESYVAAADSVYFTNAVVELFLDEGARLRHFKVQREGERAFHIAATGAEVGPAAAYDLTTVTLGARLSRHGINVRMAHEGAECWVDGLYLVGDDQHADTHSTIDHVAPRCTSHQVYKGILDGRSRAVFNGKVYVRPGAQQTDAQQTNKNLLLSSDARVDTKPQLEIFADDVKCSHGATVGQLEEEELFYLKSRGLHDELARNLLTYGFAEELIEKIDIELIKRQLDEAILNRLHARLEA